MVNALMVVGLYLFHPPLVLVVVACTMVVVVVAWTVVGWATSDKMATARKEVPNEMARTEEVGGAATGMRATARKEVAKGVMFAH